MNFKNMKMLENVKTLLNEASEGLKDKNRVIENSPISKLLTNVLLATHAGLTFTALCNLGVFGVATVGPTSIVAASMLTPLAPAAAIVGLSTVLIAKKRQSKLTIEKQKLYKDAIAKQNAIINELKKQYEKTKERADYLESLNRALTKIIKELGEDLGELNA